MASNSDLSSVDLAGARARSRRFAVAALLVLYACGGGGAPPAPTNDPDGGDEDVEDAAPRPVRDAGTPKDAGDAASDSGDSGSGSDGGDSSIGDNPNGPLIEVLSPTETDDPNSEAVLSSATVTVRCEVKRNPIGERVDPNAIKVTITDSAGGSVSQRASATSTADVFEAQNVSLADIAHGSVRISCEAADLATVAQKAATVIHSLYDRGPEITLVSPMDEGFVPAGVGPGEDVRVQFRVIPKPLADGDTGAKIGAIKASVSGKTIAKIDPSTVEEGAYSFGLDFNDTQFFSVVPEDISVTIEASNGRSPKPRTVTKTIGVGVDAQGPTITVKSPQRSGGLDAVVSGKVDVLLEVKDTLAGVDPNSLEIRIEKKASDGQPAGKDTYKAMSQGTNYVATFDTGTYPGLASLSITLFARDKVGNETQSNLPVDVDSVPPWISLTPPTVREVNIKTTGNECSGPFDPLGAGDISSVEMIDDLEIVNTAFRPRVLIWDRALTIPNVVTRVAMVTPESPRLYIQHNVSVPLLVDTDQDANHECDTINVSSQNTSLAPVTLTLTAVTPSGGAPPAGSWVEGPPMTFQLQTDFASTPDATGYCAKSVATSFPPPQPLAPDTNMTRIIKHTAQGGGGVVYVDSPSPTGLRNTGKDYQSPRNGWACLVAAATDNAGNAAFSPPIRGCFHSGDPSACMATSPPQCTDGCVIPARFRADAPDAMPRLLFYR